MSFFHCCLLEPRLCAEELSMRVVVVRFGKWTRTLHLPGYWKRMARIKWEPANLRPRAPRLTVTSATFPVTTTYATGSAITFTATTQWPTDEPDAS